jgi:hypothetical protein
LTCEFIICGKKNVTLFYRSRQKKKKKNRVMYYSRRMKQRVIEKGIKRTTIFGESKHTHTEDL